MRYGCKVLSTADRYAFRKSPCLPAKGSLAGVKRVQDFVRFREFFGEFVIGRTGLASVRALVKRERVFGARHRRAVPIAGFGQPLAEPLRRRGERLDVHRDCLDQAGARGGAG